MRRDVQTTVDWFGVIWDMVQREISVLSIAQTTGIPESAIRGYIAGAHPPHWRGELLISQWIIATGRTREELPMETLRQTIRVVHSPKTKQFFGGDKGAALAAAWRVRNG